MKRSYRYRGIDWTDREQVNAYKRENQVEWRRRNPERYRAAVARWRLNGKLRACGLVDEGVRGGRG